MTDKGDFAWGCTNLASLDLTWAYLVSLKAKSLELREDVSSEWVTERGS